MTGVRGGGGEDRVVEGEGRGGGRRICAGGSGSGSEERESDGWGTAPGNHPCREEIIAMKDHIHVQVL